MAKKMKDGTYQYYAGSVVYKNDKTLNYLLMEEGMVNKSSGGYVCEYHLKDHLGNVRVTFQPNGTGTTLTQATDYYPFGMNYPQSPGGTNKYLYNGKEKQDDQLSGTFLDWYDYGARMYDPTIERWHSVDPLAGKYYSISPYVYCTDNPIKLIDPDGKDIWDVNETGHIKFIREDKKQDVIRMVDDKGKIKKDDDGNDVSISFKGGTVKTTSLEVLDQNDKSKTIDYFQVKGDDNGEKTFEFLANPEKTTTVEWSHAKVGNEEGMNGSNLIGTTNEHDKSGAGSAVNAYGFHIRELNHNHPNGSFTVSKGDADNRSDYLKTNPGVKLNIYSNGTYRPYSTLKDFLNPNWDLPRK